MRGWNRAIRRVVIAGCLSSALCGACLAQAAEWLTVDYGNLVDRRELSHSSESVAVLLDKLEGRPLPPPGERAQDRYVHSLLDPLLEPYAFVLPDAADAVSGVPDPPMVELGSLWHPGERQPAWVELLRARRFVVESDGAGNLRLFLPATGSPPPSGSSAAEQARLAYEAAWPVLRHVFAAEQARLGPGADRPPPLRVTVYVYRHQPARTRYVLGGSPHSVELRETLGDGLRVPLDLEGMKRFLEQGLQLEGGRLEADGTLHIFGSQVDSPPSILGRPLSLADMAIAFRAVFHGGLAEPYMSLDRGLSPQTALVNYGGRLRDTGLGMVSLECDIRFKTFSLGIDIATGTDERDRLRREIPGFRTHLERFADDLSSAGVQAQQTRLWFYPDAVDLTVSPQIDVLAMRRARMAAASERLVSATSATAASDPPWTLETVGAINRQYDRFGAIFPELADLDQVVRMLSFFTWLKQAELAGLALPDLDALLAVDLPQVYTPRNYPQLLTFDALPESGRELPVVVFDRVAVGDALGRLGPRGDGVLRARARFERARAALDPDNSQEAAMLAELADYDLDTVDDSLFDLLTYRAERLRMHRLVLSTLSPESGKSLAERQQAGERLRIFSVGIGGLDLGMGRALARASGTRLQLASARGGNAAGPIRRGASIAPARTVASEPREEWRVGSAVRPTSVPPDHGTATSDPTRLRLLTRSGTDPMLGRWILSVTGVVDPEVRSRKVYLAEKRRAGLIERVEGARRWRYRFTREGAVLRAEPEADRGPTLPTAVAGDVPEGLVQLTLVEAPSVDPTTSRVRLQFSQGGTPRQLEADFPRVLLQRLVMGREVDMTRQPIPLAPLPPALGAVEAVMFRLRPGATEPPWQLPARAVPGEDDPVRLARALRRWSVTGPADQAAPPSVVGSDPALSPARWTHAPRPAGGGLLLLPDGAFTGKNGAIRQELTRRWSAGPVVPVLPRKLDPKLVVMVSDEPPGLCASRLARLAAEPAMSGKLLAGWCLAGELRPDVAPSLIRPAGVAALGVAASAPVDLRMAVQTLEELSTALGDPLRESRRVETLPGPFLWFF